MKGVCVMSGDDDAPIFSRDLIEAHESRRYCEKVFIRSWEAYVWVRVVNAGEWDQLNGMVDSVRIDPLSFPDFHARGAAVFLSDENGKRLYNDKEVPILNQMDARAIEEVWTAGARLNKHFESAIEDTEKNS